MVEKFTSLYYSQHEAKLCNRILAICSSFLFFIMIILWITKPIYIVEDPVWVYTLFIFIPAFVLMLSFLFKYRPVMKKISEEDYKSFSTFSVIVLLTNIIQFIAYRADYWIITLYYDHDAVGVYAQASKFAQLLWIIPGILAALIIPALKNEQQKLTRADLLSVIRLSFYFHFLLSLVVILVAFFIYSFFLPSEFYNGFFSMLIMLPGYLLFIIATLFAAYFSANRLLKTNLYGSILCCCLIIILDLLLIPHLNYKGAAIANLLSYSIATIYFIYKAMPEMKMTISDLFVIRKDDFAIFSTKILKPDTDIE